ncbi:hypothetical protein BK130_21745 [Viridibacillus sp. FSL H8-0123]|uniref:Uncharacterized protein n=1 Tax=Viridibacillus arenosi FSL R5-213 TaxID=1227360 RepID=W4EW42_9BACL|nr:hypothetical protein C176_11873 [Viridibacillus arenosi FSL R5-213]OMC77226.1 hypothetical protein BK130_21745 [Viridibacillus sp. FSL H8-0123]OMC86717.1 hypothetical protein BK137_21405 [Viridibacillus arenosi]
MKKFFENHLRKIISSVVYFVLFFVIFYWGEPNLIRNLFITLFLTVIFMFLTSVMNDNRQKNDI